MTPVLAMTVVREAAIAAFVQEKFYTVALSFAGGGTASSKRFQQKADAEALLENCRKEEHTTVQKVERKEKTEKPPQLYDLTSLQRDANRLLGFTAQQTLTYAQSLYEKKLITYPRTDSRFLTEDMAASLPGLVADTAGAFGVADEAPVHVQQVIDSSKVTDHHALLPTASMEKADLSALPAGELSVLRLIAARLLCAVGEPHRYAETTLTTTCASEEFTAKGKVVLSEGWKDIERKMLGNLLGKKKESALLPDVAEQCECCITGAELKEGQTSAPKHFTEDLLLSAMQTAGSESMPEGVERQGIGTPATRAATIEKLVQKGFLERKGNQKTKILLPTDKGKALVAVMPEEIQSPEMTSDWETKLLRIERGEMEPEEFMTEISRENTGAEQQAYTTLEEVLAAIPQWSDEEALQAEVKEQGGRVMFCYFFREHNSMVQLTQDRNGKFEAAYVLDAKISSAERKAAAQEVQRLLAEKMEQWGMPLMKSTIHEKMKYEYLEEAASHLMQALNAPESITG